MGLDALDLAFRLEKQFGIKVRRDEIMAAFFDTPGTLYCYLTAKLRGEYREVPILEPLFRDLSTAISSIRGRWKATDLNRVFPADQREADWQLLETAMNVTLPQLECVPGEQYPRIPRKCDSIPSLLYWISEHHPERVQWRPVSCEAGEKAPKRVWTDKEVWDVMTECIVGALGVKRDAVTPDARMVENLGMQ